MEDEASETSSLVWVNSLLRQLGQHIKDGWEVPERNGQKKMGPSSLNGED
jgi:hypothetical protein